MFLKHKKFRQTDGQSPTISAVNANGLKSEKWGIFHGGAIFRSGAPCLASFKWSKCLAFISRLQIKGGIKEPIFMPSSFYLAFCQPLSFKDIISTYHKIKWSSCLASILRRKLLHNLWWTEMFWRCFTDNHLWTSLTDKNVCNMFDRHSSN